MSDKSGKGLHGNYFSFLHLCKRGETGGRIIISGIILVRYGIKVMPAWQWPIQTSNFTRKCITEFCFSSGFEKVFHMQAHLLIQFMCHIIDCTRTERED